MKLKYNSSTRFEKFRYLLLAIFAIGVTPEEDGEPAIFYINLFGREWLWSIE